MKELINKIENNEIITSKEKEILVDSITLGGSVSVNIRMRQVEVKMAVLEILHNANNAMTITEIQNQFILANGYAYTVQKFSAMTRQLICMGLIDRNTITTGNSIIIKGKRQPKKIAKFSLVNAWQTTKSMI